MLSPSWGLQQSGVPASAWVPMLRGHSVATVCRRLIRRLVPRLYEVELAGPVERMRSSFVGDIKHMPIRYRLRG